MLSFDGRFKSGRSALGLVRKTLFVNQILKNSYLLITSRAFQLLRFVFSLVLASMTSLLVRFIMIMMLSSNLSVLEL